MPLAGVKVIAWDFDGVLNNNIQDGAFIWSRNFERDLGLPIRAFATYLFKGRYQQAMRGEADLKTIISDWLNDQDTNHAADHILDYWFTRDALPDLKMLTYLEHASARNLINIIATNNEIHRARFIEEDMGFGDRVDHFFAAGRMRTAKPEPAYFKHIESTLSLPPDVFLLIDDMSENIQAAKCAGWKAHHHDAGDYAALEDIFGL